MVEPEDKLHGQCGDEKRVWEEANAWLLRLHSGAMSEDERREFRVWLGHAPSHESQFRRAELFWNALDGLAGEVTRKPPVVPQGSSEAIRPVPAGLSEVRIRSSSRWGIAVAAMVLLVVLSSVMWSVIDVWLSDYRTHPGEQMSVSLADGSTVHLNTRSALSVDLSDRRRALLLKQGEALFEVAHDSARPFEVSVNGGIVRAIGTVFNIDHRGSRTTVSVVEGAVRLLHNKGQRDIPAGYRLTYEREESPGALEPINRPQVTAWRQREFVFEDMPLELIVEQLNRYRTGPIVVMDAGLRSRRLSGSIALDDPERSLRMLQQVLPFRAVHVTPYLTLISF